MDSLFALTAASIPGMLLALASGQFADDLEDGLDQTHIH
jgi:hypothetical protein